MFLIIFIVSVYFLCERNRYTIERKKYIHTLNNTKEKTNVQYFIFKKT